MSSAVVNGGGLRRAQARLSALPTVKIWKNLRWFLRNRLEICKKIISKYGNEKNKQYKTLKHEYDELESSLLILLVVKKLVSEKLYIAELEDKRLIKGRNKRNI